MTVKIKENKHIQYMHIKTIHREMQNCKACTLEYILYSGE